jgi:hypothetical protein
MAVTYGRITHGNEDPFLVRARELLDIGLRLVTPEKAAMLTAFPFRKFHNPIVVFNNLNVENVRFAVEKLPTWCTGRDYSLIKRCRELSPQLLNEPFNEVKAQMVRFRILNGHLFVIYPLVGRGYDFKVISR